MAYNLRIIPLTIIFIVLDLTCVTESTTIQNHQLNASSYRLSNKVLPISYDLWIFTELPLANFTYEGKAVIVIKILESTKTLTLHVDGLIIKADESSLIQFENSGNRSVPIHHQFHDHDKQFYTLNFLKDLEPGVYTLTLTYHGEILDDVFGFYRSSHNVNGETRWIGLTQFSPTFARRAFPCMDEPGFKANFNIHIGHYDNQTATSNMPAKHIRKTNRQNYSITSFLPTPKMSSYLVGWIIHDFRPEISKASKHFQMWTRIAMKSRGSFALNQGQEIFSTLQDWLSVESPIKKFDQFAVPDFNFNAMENWGLITYKEPVVLFENGSTPARTMIRGLTTMAHEYAHSWFGNLVTPKFWDVVWLKEGFASYFQYFGVSLMRPEWKAMEMFVVDYLQPTLLADSEKHFRTMNGREVGSPGSVMATLDFVSYRKAAAVIRMISHTIGASAFREGLQKYLRHMSYKAAIPSNLYEHLQSALDQWNQTGISINDIIESWANQPGYPLITVARNHSSKFCRITQEKFYLNRKDGFKKEFAKQGEKDGWWIPLTFATSSENSDFSRTSVKRWLKPTEKSTTVGPFDLDEWLIFNVRQVGYYRVNYDVADWNMLIDFLKSENFGKVNALNRAALLDDAFNLARAGYVDYSIAFNLSRYLARETEYEPWVAAINDFNFLNWILSGVPRVQKLFQGYVQDLLIPIYDQLSFAEAPTDDLARKLQRELILSASCSVNNDHCLKTSRNLFRSWISADKTILPDLKSFVYCVGVRLGDENDWLKLWEKFLSTDLQTEQELLLNGLGCTTKSSLIHRYLSATISSEGAIRKQYRMTIVNSVLNGNPRNTDYMLEFIEDNLQQLIERGSHSFLGKILTALGNKITREEQVNKLRRFLEKNAEVVNPIGDVVKSATAIAETNIVWIKKYSSIIGRLLS